jgi:hypothetical protein
VHRFLFEMGLEIKEDVSFLGDFERVGFGGVGDGVLGGGGCC